MDPVFAMDETLSLARGSRLVRSTHLTGVMRREHADDPFPSALRTLSDTQGWPVLLATDTLAGQRVARS